MSDRTLLIWQLVVMVFVGGWVVALLSVRVRRLEQLRARQPGWSDMLGKLRQDVADLRADLKVEARRRHRRLDELQAALVRLEATVQMLALQSERPPNGSRPPRGSRPPDLAAPKAKAVADGMSSARNHDRPMAG